MWAEGAVTGIAATFTLRGVPFIYQGEEIGTHGLLTSLWRRHKTLFRSSLQVCYRARSLTPALCVQPGQLPTPITTTTMG